MKENWYDRHILPYLIDLACGIGPVARQREKVVPQARGRVLEIGLGTGRNIPYYDPRRVSQIVGVDPALRMHHLADRRIARSGLNVELIGLSAEKLPAADASFDTVVCTYTLCTIPDPVAALAEMKRVLVPGGRQTAGLGQTQGRHLLVFKIQQQGRHQNSTNWRVSAPASPR